jgi:hypothetical protein
MTRKRASIKARQTQCATAVTTFGDIETML